MDLLVNDCSLAGQFHDVDEFRRAFGRLMHMRELGRRYGHQVSCNRNIAHARVTPDLTMVQAIQHFSRDERRSIMQWVTQGGPFWDDLRMHSADEYLECSGEIITDTAIAEAAFRSFHGNLSHLTSLDPSAWNFTPVDVIWSLDSQTRRQIAINNYWDGPTLEAVLRVLEPPVESWGALENRCISEYRNLEFSADAFTPLTGHPFAYGAARRVLVLLGVLDRAKRCFDEGGNRTQEGDQLYQAHFTGAKAWFSDSSDTEKADFEAELTFAHPDNNAQSLFCPWHGKIKTPQLRIHFSSPIRFNSPLYVVYIGPKITKR